MTHIYETFSEAETMALAAKVAAKARSGQVYCLYGDLGAGKTAFVRGFAKALSVRNVKSPTFSILNIYDGRLPIYHFDAYRLVSPDELSETGYDDYFYGSGVCLIEWADMIEELLPDDMVRIRFAKDVDKDFDYRAIAIEWDEGALE